MSTPRGSSLPSLTGMRIIAAVLVAAFHIGALAPFADPDIAKAYHSLFDQGGWAGVTFFFVLSGFVLTWAVRPSDTLTGFWRRRLFKVFPNHLLTVTAGIFLLVYLDVFPGVGVAVSNVLLVHDWDWRFTTWWGVNPVSWSLCAEAFFYLCFPFLIKLVNRIPAERLWVGVAGTVAAITAIPSLAKVVIPEEAPVPGMPISATELWFINGFPPVRTLDFLLGILLARMVREGRLFRLPLPAAVLLAVGGYWLSTQVPYEYSLAACTGLPFGLLIASAARADLGGQWSPFRGRVMVWLGEISFAFYLWHYLVLIWLGHLFQKHQPLSTAGTWGFIGLALAVVVVLSWATFRGVETPVMRRFASSRRPRAAVAGAGARAGAAAGFEPLAEPADGSRR
ncbi:acyltransferase family protein [Streptomyces sp. NPDC058301]|uniref:acyltransferase family protein n=1 Tax=Streptomyces sp. NPDC058301 TaxID=3346436 RepID=UPI0036EDDA32